MIVCPTCRKEMSVTEIGIPVVTLAGDGEPYQILSGDRLTCPVCLKTVIANFGKPLYRHQADFAPEYKFVKDDPRTVVVK